MVIRKRRMRSMLEMANAMDLPPFITRRVRDYQVIMDAIIDRTDQFPQESMIKKVGEIAAGLAYDLTLKATDFPQGEVLEMLERMSDDRRYLDNLAAQERNHGGTQVS